MAQLESVASEATAAVEWTKHDAASASRQPVGEDMSMGNPTDAIDA